MENILSYKDVKLEEPPSEFNCTKMLSSPVLFTPQMLHLYWLTLIFSSFICAPVSDQTLV